MFPTLVRPSWKAFHVASGEEAFREATSSRRVKLSDRPEIGMSMFISLYIIYMAVCQNLVPLVNIKIAGKWMFIPPNIARLVLIHPHIYIYIYFI